MYKPIIGITMGDPASIGPEIALKALLDERVHRCCRPILVGDFAVFQQIADKLNLPITIHAITDVAEAQFLTGTADVFDLRNTDLSKITFGEISAKPEKRPLNPSLK